MKGRILGIDYGQKRTGIAVTDPDQIIVSGLDTVDTNEFKEFLRSYMANKKVIKVVFGKPVHRDGKPTILWNDILKEMEFIHEEFPEIVTDFMDESFTSSDAKALMVTSGIKKKKRRDKKTVDKLSAILILQKYLGHI